MLDLIESIYVLMFMRMRDLWKEVLKCNDAGRFLLKSREIICG